MNKDDFEDWIKRPEIQKILGFIKGIEERYVESLHQLAVSPPDEKTLDRMQRLQGGRLAADLIHQSLLEGDFIIEESK